MREGVSERGIDVALPDTGAFEQSCSTMLEMDEGERNQIQSYQGKSTCLGSEVHHSVDLMMPHQMGDLEPGRKI